ncbi:MAG: tyrosine-type recombinase/integrase [Candidatus Wenzhouxiangella sp. M2_3B_020]
MPKHRVTLAPELWPQDLRARFETLPLSTHQRRRLGSALGRWLLLAPDSMSDPQAITQELWQSRTRCLPRERANEIRQVLAALFPDRATVLHAESGRASHRRADREKLATVIGRGLSRLPPDWQARAAPLLVVDPEDLQDGILVQAWASSTIKRRLQATARHFDFCRASGLPPDITRDSVRRELQKWQSRTRAGEVCVTGAAIHIASLLGLASPLWPERNWRWLVSAHMKMKKLASHQPSRNASRAVCAAELRVAGLQLFEAAERDFEKARKWRDFVKAHTTARTALTMILLSEAPLRIGSSAKLELDQHLLDTLVGLRLEASETKEKQADGRCFSRDLVNTLRRYIGRHRAVLADAGETRLFVGNHGGPVGAETLSNCLGEATMPIFGHRITPHAIRHSVANYIIATAPDEAALATTILNHKDARVTETYTSRGNQVKASRTLAAAHRNAAASLGVEPDPGTATKSTKPPRRKRPASRRGKKRSSRLDPGRAPAVSPPSDQ